MRPIRFGLTILEKIGDGTVALLPVGRSVGNILLFAISGVAVIYWISAWPYGEAGEASVSPPTDITKTIYDRSEQAWLPTAPAGSEIIPEFVQVGQVAQAFHLKVFLSDGDGSCSAYTGYRFRKCLALNGEHLIREILHQLDVAHVPPPQNRDLRVSLELYRTKSGTDGITGKPEHDLIGFVDYRALADKIDYNIHESD